MYKKLAMHVSLDKFLNFKETYCYTVLSLKLCLIFSSRRFYNKNKDRIDIDIIIYTVIMLPSPSNSQHQIFFLQIIFLVANIWPWHDGMPASTTATRPAVALAEYNNDALFKIRSHFWKISQ